jgi:hypothetical protein
LVVAGYLGSLAVMPRKPPRFLRTDEQDDAVRSLEWAAQLAQTVSTDRHLWKWIRVALHSAAQGFMVLALWDGNGMRALRDKVAAKWLEAHRRGDPYPVEKLDEFLNLYAKVKTRRGSKSAFQPGTSHDRSLYRLNEFRNEFTHFTPKGWCLELALLPPICCDTLDLVEFLGWKSGQVLWHKQTHVRRTKSAVHQMRRALRAC